MRQEQLDNLIDKIISANQETLSEYNVNLHEENLRVVDLIPIDPTNGGTNRNTSVSVQANGPRVSGAYKYFYNRIDIHPMYPSDKKLDIKLSDVQSQGLIETLLNCGDDDLDLDILSTILPEDEVDLKLFYDKDKEIDFDAYIFIDNLSHYGRINIKLTVEHEYTHVVDLGEILEGDTLDGFDQEVTPVEP